MCFFLNKLERNEARNALLMKEGRGVERWGAGEEMQGGRAEMCRISIQAVGRSPVMSSWFPRPGMIWLPGWEGLLYVSLVCWVTQSCPALCDAVDCSPPGASVHGILQARALERVATPSSKGSSRPKDGTRAFCLLCCRWILFLLSHEP